MASKYRPLFAKQLKNGLRKNGWSIEECCMHWNVSRGSYYYWVKNNPKFAEAADIGETHAAAYVAKEYREVMSGEKRGNAGLLVFAAKNVMGWAEKTETHVTHDEQVKTLNINILPRHNERKQIEIIDVTPQITEVLKSPVLQELPDPETEYD